MSDIAEPASATTTSSGRDIPSVAVIGCGAIAENFHLPALSRQEGACDEAVLVDLDRDRADELAARHGVPRSHREYEAVLGEVDGAIIALPPHLHAPVARRCIERGVHVLCEKPLAENGEDARLIVREAEAAGVHVCVNNTKRLYPSARKIRELIEDGTLGDVRSVEILWGEVFDWPAATAGYFGEAAGGRGVLQDLGAHSLDLVCWWLGRRPELESYLDDSFGGTEAVADVRLAGGGCRVHVRHSWLSKLPNRFEVRGTDGAVRTDLYEWNRISYEPSDGEVRTTTLEPALTEQGLGDGIVRNFLAVCDGREEPTIPARTVVPSIELIDECYGARERFDLPWLDAGEETLRTGTDDE